SEVHDVRGIAAEARDVLLDPLQRLNRVEKAVVARCPSVDGGGLGGRGLRERRSCQEAEDAEARLGRNDDHLLLGCEPIAVVNAWRQPVGRRRSSAKDERASGYEEHDREAAGWWRVPRHPDIEMEAVLASDHAGRSQRVRKERRLRTD